MARKPSILCIGSRTQGLCRDCRHVNQGTRDFAEGLAFCSWDHLPRKLDARCNVELSLPRHKGGEQVSGYYFFQPYDGANGTWGLIANLRMLAADADTEQRQLMRQNEPVIPADET